MKAEEVLARVRRVWRRLGWSGRVAVLLLAANGSFLLLASSAKESRLRMATTAYWVGYRDGACRAGEEIRWRLGFEESEMPSPEVCSLPLAELIRGLEERDG